MGDSRACYSAYRYDGNGNIMGIERWTLDGSGATEKMDDQTHHLTANTNQLERVEETAPVQATEVVAGYDDVRHQATTTYDYDVSGRLITDAAEDHTITYTSHDKVSQIAIGGTTTITRLYGPDGRNVLSTSTTGGNSKRTYQIYGGGIDPVAIVTQDGEGDPVVSEILIQGLGRVGVYTGDNTVAYGTTIPPPASYEIYHRTVGRKLYELTDHIGNVRAVIGDVKVPLGSDEYGVQLRSVQNYYSYGMPRPNNVWSASALTQSEPYRFGFQGMQRDADVGNATTAPSTTPFRQYDARLGRWWSVDPLSAMTGKTYQALGGNPIAMVDPWGLAEQGGSSVEVDQSGAIKGGASLTPEPTLAENGNLILPPSGGVKATSGTPEKPKDVTQTSTPSLNPDAFKVAWNPNMPLTMSMYDDPVYTNLPQGYTPGPMFSPRINGAVRVLSGAITIAALGAIDYGTAGWATPFLLAGVAFGADEIATGATEIWTGEYQTTTTNKAIKGGAQALGASESTAQTIANVGEISIAMGTNVASGMLTSTARAGVVSSTASKTTLIHYTDELGHNGIVASNELRASTGSVHARFGDGQYFTDIAPDLVGAGSKAGMTAEQVAAGQISLGQLSSKLYGVPWNVGKLSHFVEIEVSGLTLVNPRPGTLLLPNSGPLDLSGRIVRSGLTLGAPK